MSRKNKLFILVFVIFTMLINGCEKTIDKQALLKDYPAVQLGQHNSLSLDNKILILNYWASWCPPCRKEVKELNVFYQQNKLKVIVIGVNLESLSKVGVSSAIEDFGIEYPVITSDIMKLQMDINTEAYPATYIINQQGKLVKTILGPVKAGDLAVLLANI